MQNLNARDAMDRARTLWTEMLDSKSFPTDERIIRLIAGLQFPTIRDQLMADIPGIDETPGPRPHGPDARQTALVRIDWAEQVLLHAYTRSSTRHAAPILTAIAFINWWEGRGNKAHQLLQLALDADPACRLAKTSVFMISSGSAARSCRCDRIPA